MKKSILASSIAAAVFGLGATGAHAAITVNTSGTGDILLVPYFSAQSENATLLNITNTDTINGKAVKVRFRGAANSDDVFDFQVFLSPKDVWTANVSKGADGIARLTTSDASCTKPAASVLNATPFVTSRLNSTLTGDALANGTREGYIEIIGMADVPPTNQATFKTVANTTANQTFTGLRGTPATDAGVVAGTKLTTDNPLFFAIKHSSSVAPCAGTAWTDLDKTTAFGLTNTASGTGPALGLTPITGGLMANWTIVNTVNAAAWGGEAIALTSDGTKNIIYAPQIGTATGIANVTAWSADPLFLNASTGTVVYDMVNQNLKAATGVAPVIPAGYYDLPDLSTPLSGTIDAAGAATQAQNITNILAAKSSVINEFAVESAINGSTDWVFSMPTRRYSIAMAYSKITSTDDGRRWNVRLNDTNQSTTANQFQLANTSVVDGLICVSGAKPAPNDREENSPTSSSTVVVSPSTVAGGIKLCGEASVMSFNNGAGTTGALKASVAVTATDVGYQAGWATMSVAAGTASAGTPGGFAAVNNYPVTGGAFQRASFGAQGFGVFRNYR